MDPKSHRFSVDQYKHFLEAKKKIPGGTQQQQLALALDLYNGEIIRRVSEMSKPVFLDVKAGDVVIWHPQMPHGGSPAKDKYRTRWSIAAHCAPSNVQVYQHDQFFLNQNGVNLPKRYGYKTWNKRNIALAGDVAYM